MTEFVTQSGAEPAGYPSQRVYRMLSFALAISNLVLLALNLPQAVAQAAILSVLWTTFAVAAAGLPPLVVAALVGRVRPVMVRRIWGVEAIALLIAYSSAPVALGIAGIRLPAHLGMPWLVELAVLAGCSAALAWPVRLAATYLVALQLVLFALVFFVDEPLPSQALGDASRQLFFVTFFACLALALRRAGSLLDETVRLAVAESQAAATADFRRMVRQRVGLLVHDSILVALLSYAGSTESPSSAVQAQRALQAIQRASAPQDESARAPQDFVWELQALTTDVDPDAEFVYETSGTAEVPPRVAVSIVEATSEALRNSVRHAPTDRQLARAVRVNVTDEGIDVLILDDGEGFDTRKVSPARLGIRAGIVGRLLGVRGGSAEVSSRIGYGTTIALRWRRT